VHVFPHEIVSQAITFVKLHLTRVAAVQRGRDAEHKTCYGECGHDEVPAAVGCVVATPAE